MALNNSGSDFGSSQLVHIEGLEAWYGSVQALFGVNLDARAGESIALVGTNGAGKTTILRSLLGLVKVKGVIRIGGESLTSMPTYKRCKQFNIGTVHEGRGLFYELSVLDNIRIGSKLLDRESTDSVIELFPALQKRLSELVGKLSGGEQQMVAIARLLARNPRIILLDEPGLGLSPRLVSEVYSYLDRVKTTGATIVLVEQNVERAVAFADRLFLVAGGRVVDQCATSDPEAVKRIERSVFETTE